MERPAKPMSAQEWENLIDDFQSGGPRRERWLAQFPGTGLLELALHHLLRKDSSLSLKALIILFVEENCLALVPELDACSDLAFGAVLDALRSLVQSPVDAISVTFAIKEQMMVCTTSFAISIDALERCPHLLQALTELLLTVINRPNHGLDRQTRATACECLRELENAYPCLLAEITPHLWSLCQSERTHASQSYTLLLTSAIHNLVLLSPGSANISVLSTSVPLVPFNIPHSLIASAAAVASLRSSSDSSIREASSSGLNPKELRKVMAFLLERPQILTPCGMMEFMWMLLGIASALDLQAPLLKVQFSGLLYSYDPILCHVVLMLYSRFSDALDGQESEIARRLTLMSKEVQQHLVFRLLFLHWLLGFKSIKNQSILPMVSEFHPSVFDPLALKTLKLDVLAYCGMHIVGGLRIEGSDGEGAATGAAAVKLFQGGLVCVSAFKWLPPWSSETAVAFRTIHKYLIGGILHYGVDESSSSSSLPELMESVVFRMIQGELVDMALEFSRLVPVIVTLVDRLLACPSHFFFGERILQTFDEHMLPKLSLDYQLASYFPIMDRIAENVSIPPLRLLELLSSYLAFLVEKHGPDTGLRSWSHGSRVLGICRTMLAHHHSSRVFLPLSQLLAHVCWNFPDLEVRDNSRIYLRMLLCIPGKKLRQTVNLDEKLPDVSASPHLSAFFPTQTTDPSCNLKRLQDVSSYIHLEREIPLLVKQSWSLAVSTFGIENKVPSYFEGIRDSDPHVDIEGEVASDVHPPFGVERIEMIHEPLRVMDSKVSAILETLRRHFASIPDFRHMPGLKIRIPCTLRFDAKSFSRIWGADASVDNLDVLDSLPALYAILLTFSSPSPYGPIRPFRIPILFGEPLTRHTSPGPETCLDIVPAKNGSGDNESSRSLVVIELEPREPMPGLVNASIEANAESGQIIRGPLQSITVGIEDMFLKALVPSDVDEGSVCEYYSDLFDALWEACGSSASTGREAFLLGGGKGVAAINGTRSVKLLEVAAYALIGAVECHLAPYVVSVIGQSLVDVVKDGRAIKDVIWRDEPMNHAHDDVTMVQSDQCSPLQLKYFPIEDDLDGPPDTHTRNMGCFHVLIFLPPRFHLLFQMEVGDHSTLVRIRTDHWPCLAYIDDFLESLL